MIVAEPTGAGLAEPGAGRSILDRIGALPELTVGWAVWTVRDGRLRSVDEALTWPARHPAVARCPVQRHVAPSAGCSCGVHAVTESGAAEAVRRASDDPLVVGCVALWGQVEDGGGDLPGWRGKRAHPLFVVADDRTTPDERRELAAAYGVPAYRALEGISSLFTHHRQVVWWTIRHRLQALLEGTAVATPLHRAVADVLDTVVTTWSAAERWRHGRAASVVGAPTAPTTVPDVAGIVVAWRSWNLAGGRLVSVTRTDQWPDRAPMVARCARGSGHHVPDETCTCGIYAARGMDHAARYHSGRGADSVIGCVALWGGLVEASFGWRAEKAYPLVLFAPGTLPGSTRLALERRYGVPVHRADVLSAGAPAVRAAETLRAALERDHGRPADTSAVDAFLTTARGLPTVETGRAATRPPSSTPSPRPLVPSLRPPARPAHGLTAAACRIGLEWRAATAAGVAMVLAAVVVAIVMGVHG